MRNMYCKISGHDYKVSRDVRSYVKEYSCNNCKKELPTNSKGDLYRINTKI
ncbi:hypothetical protein GCM10022397_40080 [Flavivirga jejuensis]